MRALISVLWAASVAAVGPGVAFGQDTSDTPGARTVQAIQDGNVEDLRGLVGARVELADPSLRGLLGLRSPEQVIALVRDCDAQVREGGWGAGSFRIDFDCPSNGQVPSLPDCATENWILDAVPSRGSDRFTILSARRGNEGECYRPPIAPPMAPARSQN